MKRTPQIDPEWYRKCSQNRSGGRFLNTSGSEEQAKTTRNVAVEMAMDLCIDEKDEERQSEAQSIATFRVVFACYPDISTSFGNKRRSLLSPLPCGRPRP